jgi:hypothetical protein
VIGDEDPVFVTPDEEVTVNPVMDAPPSAPGVNATETTAVVPKA